MITAIDAPFAKGDKVKWNPAVDPEGKGHPAEYYGPGPFEIFGVVTVDAPGGAYTVVSIWIPGEEEPQGLMTTDFLTMA